MGIASPGGNVIPQAISEVLLDNLKFGKNISDSIEALGIKRRKTTSEKKYNWDDKKYYTVENVVGMDVKEAVKTLSKYNVTYSGSGNKVISQSPKANTRLEEGSTVRLMLGN